MKKLLVLLTVLAIAGTASATISIVAPAEVMEHTAFNLGLSVVAEPALITDLLVVSGNAVSYDASGVTQAAIRPPDSVPYFEDVSSSSDYIDFAESLGITNILGIYYYEYVDVAYPPYTWNNETTILSDIMVTAGAAGESIFVTMIDGANGVLKGESQEVKVIPEPMTIALLGLGGLFLRRRK